MISRTWVKVGLCALMVWDHIAVIWLPGVALARIPGAVVLPGFAWLGVTSSQKTKDFTMYAWGLVALALLSQPFYAYALRLGDRLNDIFGLAIAVLAAAVAFKKQQSWPFVIGCVGSLAGGISSGFIATMAAYAAYALYDSFPTMSRDVVSGRWFYAFYPGHLLALGLIRAFL